MTDVPVAIVGGGITGLAAAWEIAVSGGEAVLFEADPRLGGKLRTVELAGRPVDVGADAFLARRPEGEELARAVGLGDRLTIPAERQVQLALDGRLRPLPAATVMGVPTALGPLLRSRALPVRSALRVLTERLVPREPPRDDRSVGDLVTERLGRDVVDRLVEPLLGGVYAGDVDQLSVRATAPALAEAATSHRSLGGGLRAARRAGTAADGGPVFLGLIGGMEQLAGAIADGTGERVTVRSNAPVRTLERSGEGWRITAAGGGAVTARAVVLALPARPAAALLKDLAPEVAAALRAIDYASVATVALAYPGVVAERLPDGSGLLVPRIAGRDVKAASWSSRKWPHLAGQGPFVLRASVGRAGSNILDEHDDDGLVELASEDLHALVGLDVAPLATHVARWPRSLPQYVVGHLERVAELRRLLRRTVPGIELAGAALDGIGVAPCIASGRDAATRAIG